MIVEMLFGDLDRVSSSNPERLPEVGRETGKVERSPTDFKAKNPSSDSYARQAKRRRPEGGTEMPGIKQWKGVIH